MSDNYISRYGPAPCQLLLKRVMSLKVGERSLVRILLVKHQIVVTNYSKTKTKKDNFFS